MLCAYYGLGLAYRCLKVLCLCHYLFGPGFSHPCPCWAIAINFLLVPLLVLTVFIPYFNTALPSLDLKLPVRRMDCNVHVTLALYHCMNSFVFLVISSFTSLWPSRLQFSWLHVWWLCLHWCIHGDDVGCVVACFRFVSHVAILKRAFHPYASNIAKLCRVYCLKNVLKRQF